MNAQNSTVETPSPPVLPGPDASTLTHNAASDAPVQMLRVDDTPPPPPMPSPMAPTSPPPKRSSGRTKIVLFSTIALLVGVGVGYAVSTPAKSDLADQRDEARSKVVQLTDDLAAQADELAAVKTELATAATTLATTKTDLETAAGDLLDIKARLDSAQAELATAETDLADASAARQVCEQAAVAGDDLAMQWANYVDDFLTWWFTPPDTAAEAELEAHMNEQLQKMQAQADELDDLLTACTAA